MLILLDIDGVMVPAKSWSRPELLKDGFPEFSARATHVLNNLISQNCTVVLTTSHKSNYSIEEWKSIFRNRNIDIENLKCLPENINNLSRKDEIISWFNVTLIHDLFLILDDDKSLNDLPHFLKENLIQTSPYIGLTEEHLELARTILNNQIKQSVV